MWCALVKSLFSHQATRACLLGDTYGVMVGELVSPKGIF